MTDYKAEIEEEIKAYCNLKPCFSTDRNCGRCERDFIKKKLIEARQEIDRLNNDLKQAL